MTPARTPIRRRTVLVNARLQVGTALVPAAVVLAGGILFAVIFHGESRDALLASSFRGHFPFRTPYDVVGDLMIRRLLALFAVVTVAGGALLLLLLRRIARGFARIEETFRISAEGDLSSPADVRGPRPIADLGGAIDGLREQVLERIGEIRAEVESLRKEPVPRDELLRRWKGLKEKIGRIAP